MVPHRESTKRESRVRVGAEIKSLPTDVHTRLQEETAAYRYRTSWDCAIYALSLGLSLMRNQRDRTREVIYGREQTGTTGGK